jgi:hypothetical protein
MMLGLDWLDAIMSHLSHDARVYWLDADLLCVEVEPVHQALCRPYELVGLAPARDQPWGHPTVQIITQPRHVKIQRSEVTLGYMKIQTFSLRFNMIMVWLENSIL